MQAPLSNVSTGVTKNAITSTQKLEPERIQKPNVSLLLSMWDYYTQLQVCFIFGTMECFHINVEKNHPTRDMPLSFVSLHLRGLRKGNNHKQRTHQAHSHL